MSFEFCLFWLFLLLLSEISSGKLNTSYALSLIIYIILLVVILLFWYEIDLFASIVLAIYSSVFILLSLLFVYFHRLISKQLFETQSEISPITEMILLFLCFYFFFTMQPYYGFAYVNSSMIYLSNSWVWLLDFTDFYSCFFENNNLTANLMHTVLYKFFNLEILILNIYLFFGLVLAILILLIFKLFLNPSVIGRILSLTRFKFWFFFPTNARIRVANKLKRQIRRKNTSHIKHK